MTEHLSIMTGGQEPTTSTPFTPIANSPETPPGHAIPTRFDTLSLEDLLKAADNGRDKDGAPITNNDLDAIMARVARWRRLRNEVQGARKDLKRRGREDDTDSENTPSKRVDIKYDEVDSLTLKSTFRAWTDWKADLERVWAGAPWKYQRDNLKIIKALSKMNKACRARWNAYVRINLTKEGDYTHFLDWTRTLVRNNFSFETTVYEEYERANQRDNQSPVDFDAYLSSIEQELPEVSDSVQANRYYAKLNENVVKQIKLSGLQTLPNTRTEMVALAQRVWEGLRPKQNRDVTKLSLAERISKPPTFSQPERRHQQSNHRTLGPNDFKSKSIKGEKPKHELICFSCGQAGHKRTHCPDKKSDTKSKPKLRVQQQRVVSRNAATSDDETSENE